MKPLIRTTGRARSVHVRGVVALFALGIILFGFDALSGGALRTPVRSLVALGAAVRGDTGTTFSGTFATRESLEVVNRALRDELAQRQFDVTALNALREENARLRDIAHLAESMRGGVTVPVVSDGSSPYGTVLLGAGANVGITSGDVVFSPDGFVIGRVSDVQTNTALVTELFASGASIQVTLSDASLTLDGRGGGNGTIKAPRSLTVSEGAIVTAPLFAHAPVATVGKVESDPSSAYRDVYVRTPANLSSLRFVYVKKP